MNNSPDLCRAWFWLSVESLVCGMAILAGTPSLSLAQENSTSSSPESPVVPESRAVKVLPTGDGIPFKRNRLTLIGQVETPAASQGAAASPQPDLSSSVAKPNSVPEFLPRLSANEQKILDALSEATEVAFTDNPLEEALNYLEDVHNIEVWIDKESLISAGINTDQQVTLVMSGISLRSALRLLLEPLGLTYVIEDEVMKITTQTVANKAVITRTYPVGDLFSNRDEAEELVESLVCGLGLTQKGKEELKPLAVSVPSGAIIARLSRPQNDQLLQLLRDLREAKSLVPNRSNVIELPGSRARSSTKTLHPTPSHPTLLDEFSPGLESTVPVPRFRVIEQPDTPLESLPSGKGRPDR